MRLKVALLQMQSCGMDMDASREKGSEFCRKAAALGADIALFPEMWSTGYLPDGLRDEAVRNAWNARAVDASHEWVRSFQNLAQGLNMAIALTYLECLPGLPRNTVSLIDRHGRICLTYAKVHTCDFDVECYLTPGEEFKTCTLDTAAGEVNVGAMICYDREFPESARVLMLQGAELVLVPNACEMETHRTAQLQVRAFENMFAVALANYAGPGSLGHSVAFDPIAFTLDEKPRDTLVVRAGEEEGIYIAEFDLERLREYRRREAWGNAYRKPRAYGLLVSEQVDEPFIRPDARR